MLACSNRSMLLLRRISIVRDSSKRLVLTCLIAIFVTVSANSAFADPLWAFEQQGQSWGEKHSDERRQPADLSSGGSQNATIAVSKPTEADALNMYQRKWGYAAKKKFFAVSGVKKIEGQMLTINGVHIYKMYVDVTLHAIWAVVVCQRSNPFDNSTDSLHMMRAGEFHKEITDEERAVFTGHYLGSITSCKPKEYGEQEKILFRRVLVFEEFESGWRLSNLAEAVQLQLHEKYLVGEEADSEISKMTGLQGVVARAATTGVEKSNPETIMRYVVSDEAKGDNKRLFGVKYVTDISIKPGFGGAILSVLAGHGNDKLLTGDVIEYIEENTVTNQIKAKTFQGKYSSIGWVSRRAIEEINEDGTVKSSSNASEERSEVYTPTQAKQKNIVDLLKTSKNRVYIFKEKDLLNQEPKVFSSGQAIHVEAGMLAEFLEDEIAIVPMTKLRLADGQEGWTLCGKFELIKKTESERAEEERLKNSDVKKVILKKESYLWTTASNITNKANGCQVAVGTIGEYLGIEKNFLGPDVINVRLPNGKEGYFNKPDVEIQEPKQ